MRHKITYKSGRVAIVSQGIHINTFEEIEKIEKIDEIALTNISQDIIIKEMKGKK